MFAVPLGQDGARLFPLEPAHADELLANIERGRESIGRYIGLADAITDLDSSRAFLRSYAEKAAADSGRIYGIRTAEGTLVGGVLFRTMDLARGTAEAGCWLEPAGVGRGLVTRAARVIIDWAVEERGVHRVEWVACSENRPSIAVAERLGMSRDGVLRGANLHRGERQDLEVWSVLAPEWRAGRARAGRADGRATLRPTGRATRADGGPRGPGSRSPAAGAVPGQGSQVHYARVPAGDHGAEGRVVGNAFAWGPDDSGARLASAAAPALLV